MLMAQPTANYGQFHSVTLAYVPLVCASITQSRGLARMHAPWTWGLHSSGSWPGCPARHRLQGEAGGCLYLQSKGIQGGKVAT